MAAAPIIPPVTVLARRVAPPGEMTRAQIAAMVDPIGLSAVTANSLQQRVYNGGTSGRIVAAGTTAATVHTLYTETLKTLYQDPGFAGYWDDVQSTTGVAPKVWIKYGTGEITMYRNGVYTTNYIDKLDPKIQTAFSEIAKAVQVATNTSFSYSKDSRANSGGGGAGGVERMAPPTKADIGREPVSTSIDHMHIAFLRESAALGNNHKAREIMTRQMSYAMTMIHEYKSSFTLLITRYQGALDKKIKEKNALTINLTNQVQISKLNVEIADLRKKITHLKGKKAQIEGMDGYAIVSVIVQRSKLMAKSCDTSGRYVGETQSNTKAALMELESKVAEEFKCTTKRSKKPPFKKYEVGTKESGSEYAKRVAATMVSPTEARRCGYSPVKTIEQMLILDPAALVGVDGSRNSSGLVLPNEVFKDLDLIDQEYLKVAHTRGSNIAHRAAKEVPSPAVGAPYTTQVASTYVSGIFDQSILEGFNGAHAPISGVHVEPSATFMLQDYTQKKDHPGSHTDTCYIETAIEGASGHRLFTFTPPGGTQQTLPQLLIPALPPSRTRTRNRRALQGGHRSSVQPLTIQTGGSQGSPVSSHGRGHERGHGSPPSSPVSSNGSPRSPSPLSMRNTLVAAPQRRRSGSGSSSASGLSARSPASI